jgi:hypothetical protein
MSSMTGDQSVWGRGREPEFDVSLAVWLALAPLLPSSGVATLRFESGAFTAASLSAGLAGAAFLCEMFDHCSEQKHTMHWRFDASIAIVVVHGPVAVTDHDRWSRSAPPQ